MTSAQEDALGRCAEIMREHFDSALLVVEVEGDKLITDRLTYRTCGHWSSAVGLAKYAKHELLNNPWA